MAEVVPGVSEVTAEVTWGSVVLCGLTPAGEQVVLKASERSDVRAEADVLDKCSGAGLPVPAVLGRGEGEVWPGGRWLLMRRCPGTPMSELLGCPEVVGEVLGQVGNFYRELHILHVEGAGALLPGLLTTHQEWSDWLQSHDLRVRRAVGPRAIGGADR
ncbi:phosphotransferase [Kribbella sp. NPDC050124]|uniref:phosphotransferase n=1 Tax=Kribbella sp. NPDC050124 TaxID=3364114 RepID=UPI0037ACA3CC